MEHLGLLKQTMWQELHLSFFCKLPQHINSCKRPRKFISIPTIVLKISNRCKKMDLLNQNLCVIVFHSLQSTELASILGSLQPNVTLSLCISLEYNTKLTISYLSTFVFKILFCLWNKGLKEFRFIILKCCIRAQRNYTNMLVESCGMVIYSIIPFVRTMGVT